MPFIPSVGRRCYGRCRAGRDALPGRGTPPPAPGRRQPFRVTAEPPPGPRCRRGRPGKCGAASGSAGGAAAGNGGGEWSGVLRLGPSRRPQRCVARGSLLVLAERGLVMRGSRFGEIFFWKCIDPDIAFFEDYTRTGSWHRFLLREDGSLNFCFTVVWCALWGCR